MPGSAVKERLAQDVALWQADGIISSETGQLLKQRYDTPGFGLTKLVQYLGIAGGFLAAGGLLGFIAAVTGSFIVGGFLGIAISAGLFAAGLKLAGDPRARYVHSCKVVLALAVAALAGGVSAFAAGTGMNPTFVTGIVCLPVVAMVAYRFRNTFLLVLGLIGFFHWVGSWHSMIGRSTYATEIDDPKVMAAVSLLVIGIGVLHERQLRAKTLRFYQAYETLGLIYLNLSLLILSYGEWRAALGYVLFFTLAALAQLVAGAYLKNTLVLSFGVTALGVDLFTRYFEDFWDNTDKGVFFLIGGALLFAFGAVLERLTRQWLGAAR